MDKQKTFKRGHDGRLHKTLKQNYVYILIKIPDEFVD